MPLTFVDSLLERILLSLSFDEPIVAQEEDSRDPAAAVRALDRRWPGIVARLRGKRVLDFGCGTGALAVGLAREGCDVVGLDIQLDLLDQARELAGDTPVEFTDRLGESRFDWVVSVNSMEHFSDPGGALDTMRRVLAPGGRVFVTFCPTWLSPYGAHMFFFTRVPWVHLIFPERVVMRVRNRYRDDGARRYEEVTGGLNRMTVERFHRLARKARFEVDSKITYVRNQRWARHVPLVRELLSNRVNAILVPKGGQSPP